MSNIVLELFDLRQDQAEPEVIDEAIRTNVRLAGTNLWVLIFAILVASVGLNVNSTAVIIGAMLISPLMGPTVGIGYAVGINDLQLIRLALRNLGIFTAISIIASTFYFMFSPLDVVQPELLSRTSPSMWDVLIAFFGGAAGIVALTRKSMSNVIPGVAIGTALMPPLCTAGFGIAHGNWQFFGGAFFLYCINSVFIAVATWIFVKIFQLPVRHYLDEKVEQRARVLIFGVVVVMISMSLYLSYNLVQTSKFTQMVTQYVNDSYQDNSYVLLGHEVHPQLQEVILTVGGAQYPETLKTEFEDKLKAAGFANPNVTVRYSGTSALDLGSLKTELTQDLYNNMVKQVEELSKKNESLNAKVNQSNEIFASDKQFFEELRAQYPLVTNLSIGRGKRFSTNMTTNITTSELKPTEPYATSTPEVETDTSIAANDSSISPVQSTDKLASETSESLVYAMIESQEPLAEDDKTRIIEWMNVKYKNEKVEVRFEVFN